MKILSKKREKISEQILVVLYSVSPRLMFTSYIAKEIARDEEFTKKLLLDLKKKNLVVVVKRNPKGIPYLKRMRWRMSDRAYKIYKSSQS
ncbi:unnamed protein product [marine sediment metagenome]|uniref:Uncharacterized protein n=1 Tax=marine sediment metagenome TaxID=412755 RepID=X1LDE0_9ZZZZ